MSIPAATAAPKLLSGVCSQASSGASIPAARRARASEMWATPSQLRPGTEGRPGHLDGAVPVGVGLDHGHDLGR